MTSGGARARSGPAPDPKALARERDGSEWVVLPAGGRAGTPPDWPLTEASPRELEWWVRLWAYPQAEQWEKLGQAVEVAIYVRRLSEVEAPGAPAALGTLVRQLSENLGLTIPGMLRLKWHLVAPGADPTVAPSGPPPHSPRAASSRTRLKVVRGDAGA